jgi:hypothetical protein
MAGTPCSTRRSTWWTPRATRALLRTRMSDTDMRDVARLLLDVDLCDDEADGVIPESSTRSQDGASSSSCAAGGSWPSSRGSPAS